MGDAYRDENQAAVAAVAQLREQNAGLQAELEALRKRVGQVEHRLGIAPPPARGQRPQRLLAAVAGGVLLIAGVAGLLTARSSSREPFPLTGGPIGVEACDRYLAKWNACYKDPTMRSAAEPAFQQVRSSWRSMVNDPNQRAALAGACETMLRNFPESSCK